MAKLLFITPHLEYGGRATQLALLAAGLPRDRFDVRVCVLGRKGPVGTALEARGIRVEALDWTRAFDLKPAWRLREMIRTDRPAVIHAWGMASLRSLGLALRREGRHGVAPPHPVVVSAAAHEWRPGPWRVLDRWLLRLARFVVATGDAEAEACRRFGIHPDRLVVVPPGVDVDTDSSRATPGSAWLDQLPGRVLTCVGPLEAHKGFRDAVWTFDMLRFLYDDLQLVLVGRGSEERGLRNFARAVRADQQVHMMGAVEDVRPALRRADVVWVPSRREGGLNVALEAMALGRPVVASRLPGLADLVVDGATGALVAPGDKIGLARQTRVLLDDADRRRRWGEAGRQRARERFSAAGLVQRYLDLYAAAPPGVLQHSG